MQHTELEKYLKKYTETVHSIQILNDNIQSRKKWLKGHIFELSFKEYNCNILLIQGFGPVKKILLAQRNNELSKIINCLDTLLNDTPKQTVTDAIIKIPTSIINNLPNTTFHLVNLYLQKITNKITELAKTQTIKLKYYNTYRAEVLQKPHKFQKPHKSIIDTKWNIAYKLDDYIDICNDLNHFKKQRQQLEASKIYKQLETLAKKSGAANRIESRVF